MLVFAASALETMKTLPPATWAKIGIAFAAVIVAFVLIKRIAGMNKLVLGAVVVVGTVIMFFSWVYNRNEPKFLTPFVDMIAQFVPSAISKPNKAKH